ncbi:MAG: sensor histidine kinase [Bacillales bacterium]
MMKKIFTYLFIMLIVAVAGEMKFYPLGDALRINLGPAAFFFILLISDHLRPLLAGMLIGVSVVQFRIILALSEGLPLDVLLMEHVPAFFYYFVFALLFQLFQVRPKRTNPLYVGIMGALMEFSANLTELLVRFFFAGTSLPPEKFFVLCGIALIRSFFVVGFFSIFVFRHLIQAERLQKKRNDEILMHLSQLHVEMFQLKKSIKNAETLTNECYRLYRRLKTANIQPLAHTALSIAGKIHDIKKDNQRIFAGLAKLKNKKDIAEYSSIEDIFNLIQTANSDYARLLNKNIDICTEICGNHPDYHTFHLLSIINNLVANAVEAIKIQGNIHLSANVKDNMLVIYVKDDGPGIHPRNRKDIFKPGYTTKFSSDGTASNGIGLAYVKDVLSRLNGEIRLQPPEHGFTTVFSLKLPIHKLTEKG